MISHQGKRRDTGDVFPLDDIPSAAERRRLF
jgi:hypothetical protein